MKFTALLIYWFTYPTDIFGAHAMYQAGLQKADIRYLSQIQMFSWTASLFASSGTYKSLGVSRDQRTAEVISNSF